MIRFRFVEDHRGVDDVKRMCALVEVPRSSFSDWAASPTTAAQARQTADAELAVVIERVWRDSRRTYRSPREWGQLTRRRQMTVSRRRVARIMREHGFVGAHTRRRWRRGRPDVAPAADHLQRVFTAERPNLPWVADITEFPTGEGRLHVAGIRDLCHCGIVGWSMEEHQDAQLVVDALTMALGRTAGPDVEFYCNGAPVEAAYPKGPVSDMSAVNITVVSYRRYRAFGLVACPDVVTDIDQLRHDVDAEIDAPRQAQPST